MSEDHTFIGSEGNVISGREVVLGAWRGFFDAFPDYRNVWTEVVLRGTAVIALGRSVCAIDPDLDGPVIWTASVRDHQVCMWRVYEDTLVAAAGQRGGSPDQTRYTNRRTCVHRRTLPIVVGSAVA